MACIAAHIQQIHATFFEFREHQMAHLVRRQLGELKKRGMDLLDVSRYARHRTIASTEIYLHTDLSDLARQVNKAHQHVEKLLVQMEEGEEHDSQS